MVVVRTMMPVRAKITVCLLIVLGSTASVISVIRIPFIKGIRIVPNLSYFTNLIPIALLSVAETGIGIIAISLAALRPLFGRCIERSKRTYQSKNGGSRTGTMAGSNQDGSVSVGKNEVKTSHHLMANQWENGFESLVEEESVTKHGIAIMVPEEKEEV